MHPAQVVEGKAATFAASVAFGTAAFAAFVAGSRPCGGVGGSFAAGPQPSGRTALAVGCTSPARASGGAFARGVVGLGRSYEIVWGRGFFAPCR